MKKLVGIALLGLWIFLFSNETFAYDLEPIEDHINLLDLRNFEYSSKIEGSAKTKGPIVLKPETTYTLVLSQDFLGRNWNVMHTAYIEIEEESGSRYYNDLLIQDEVNLRAYYTFETFEGLINLIDIPVDDVMNYEIILYEGTYAEFPGFYPFIDLDEPLNYYGVLPMDYDDQLSLEIIQSYVVAKTPFGDFITSNIVYDTYSTSSKLPGSYQMVFEAEYNAIRKRYYLDVRIFDIKPPVLSVEGMITVPISQKLTIDQIKQKITVTDNVDQMDWQDLVVIGDTYSDFMGLGRCEMAFSATDQAGNVGEINVEIEIVDIEGPVIKGPSSIYLYTTDNPMTDVEIQNELSIIDDVDLANVSVTMILNEYQQTTVPGRYMVTYRAVDQSANMTDFSVYMHVIENRGPIFEQSEFVLSKTTADAMTESEIIAWLKDQLLLSGYQTSHVTVLYNEYENHEKEKGSYYVYMSYAIDGKEMTSRILIDVTENPFPWLWVIGGFGGFVILGAGTFVMLKRKRIKI